MLVMNTENLIKQYLSEAPTMQVASSVGGQPWVCTVYFVPDEELNLYWLSLPTRRHSQEVAKNPKIAISVPVKFDKQPVIGISTEGQATIVSDGGVVKEVMASYVSKYKQGQDFHNNFLEGKNQHMLYKFTPKSFVLFDEVNFPDDARQQWSPTD